MILKDDCLSRHLVKHTAYYASICDLNNVLKVVQGNVDKHYSLDLFERYCDMKHRKYVVIHHMDLECHQQLYLHLDIFLLIFLCLE